MHLSVIARLPGKPRITKKLFFFFLLLCLGAGLQAQDWKLKLSSNVELRTWKLTTKAESEEKPLLGANVKLMQGSTVVAEVNSDGNGDFTLMVPPGGNYVIEVSYPGCNTKRFAVTTQNVPDNVGADGYVPSFSIGGFIMAKPFPGIDYNGLKQPLVQVVYDARIRNFDDDEAATQKGLEIVSKIAQDENVLINNFCSTNKAGDVALNKPDCPLAKTLYEKAMTIIPGEPYPVEQLPKVGLCLKDKEEEAKKAEEAKLAKQKEAEEKAEKERLAKEKAEADKAEKAKAAAEKAEADRIAKEKAAAEKAEAERIAKEKAEADKVAKGKAEAEKAEADRIVKEKAAAEKAEAERIAKEKAEADKVAKNKSAAEKAEADKLAKEKALAEKTEKEKAAKEKAEADKIAKAKSAAEKAEADKLVKEKALAAKQPKEKPKEKPVAVKEKPVNKTEPVKGTLTPETKQEDFKVTGSQPASGDEDVPGKQGETKHKVRQTLGVDKYKVAITKANDYYKTKRYKEARAAYSEALQVKANDPLATSRIAEIDKLLKTE